MSDRVRRALVLAAGRGMRLGALTATTPKPLLPLGDGTILGRQLDQFAAAGIHEVSIVVGFRGADVARACALRRGPPAVETLVNEAWSGTGSGLSLAMASDLLRSGEPILLSHGDVVFDNAWLGEVLAAGGTAVAADRTWLSETGDEVLAWQRDGRLAGLRKGPPDDDHEGAGEFVGLCRLAPDFAAGFATFVTERTAVEPDLDYEQPLLSDFASLSGQDAGLAVRLLLRDDLPWRNVNDAADLAWARERWGSEKG